MAMATDVETQPLLRARNDNPVQDACQLDNEDQKQRTPETVTWRTETRLITRHSVPLIGTYLLQYFYNMIIVLVCSRLSTEELAAASLGITTTNIIGYAIFEGMATALDTLCAQAYGAGHPQLVGIHVLRFTIFIHLVAIPIGALWFFSPQIMPHLVPSAELARNASTYIRWALIGVPGYASFEAGKRFMQAQGNFTSGLMVLVACLPLNICFNWFFVFELDMRIAGAALAAGATNLIRPFLLIGYAIWYDRKTLQCWPASVKWQTLFTNWRPMVNLAIPGAIMTLSEWVAFEILTFATSYTGTVALAAQTFLATSTIVVWHLPFAASVVTSTRLGQLLGGGHLEIAKKVSVYYIFMFMVIGVVDMAITIGLLEAVLEYLTVNEGVKSNVSAALSYVVIFTFFDCMATCMHGIVRGLGWQSIGGWVTIVCNYSFLVPVSLVLELGPPDLGLRGLWIGITSGMIPVVLVEGLVIRVKSWSKLVEEAHKRQGE